MMPRCLLLTHTSPSVTAFPRARLLVRSSSMSPHALALYAMLALCSAGAILLIRRYDLARREPLWCMALAVLLGAAFMYLAVLTQRGFIRDFGIAHATEPSRIQYALIAGIFEELYKLLAVITTALLIRNHFDELLDGLIYGSLVGLGAALQESLALLLDHEHSTFLPMTEPVRLMGHLIFGGLGSAGLGWFILRRRAYVYTLPFAFVTAAALHTLWDVVAFASRDLVSAGKPVPAFHTLVSVILMLSGFLIFGLILRRGFRDEGAQCQA